jgi:hypothetical protein
LPAIDADLNAGLIDEKEARRRRKFLEDESGFFGAMDGASKFVRGDAIAGLLGVLINVIGGMAIGIVQQGLTFAEAAHTYTLLTAGDGLVTPVPALIVSTAARRRACWRSRNLSARPAQDGGQHLRHSRGRAGAPLARWPQFVSRTMACGLLQRAILSRGGTKTPLTRYHGCSRFSEAAFSGQQLALSYWRVTILLWLWEPTILLGPE